MTIKYDAQLLAGGEDLVITMYGEIGGGFFGEGITASMLDRTLRQNPNAKSIRLKLASPGGNAFEAMNMRAMLAAHPAKVNVDIEGLCASAATLIALSGDTVRMHDGAPFMIHDAETITRGDAKDHQQTVDKLGVLNDGVASLYAQRCGKSKKEMLKLMEAETWLTAEAAKEMGFVDEVIAGKGPTMQFDMSLFGYRNVPPQLMAAEIQPAHRPARESPVMLTRIALALGLAEGAEEAAILSAISNGITSRGRRDALLVELRTITGQTSDDELVGTVRGLVAKAATLATLETKLEHETKEREKVERVALIKADAADPKGRKLTPALIELYADKPLAEFKAFLNAAPRLMRMASENDGDRTQYLGALTGGGGAGEERPEASVTYQGKKWEDLKPMEKHNLRFSDAETYKALLADYELRTGIALRPKRATA